MLLALDTATRQISLALYDGQRVHVEHTWLTGQHHTVELAPQVALVLRQAAVTPAALTGLAVAIGPGSYTGLRIGLGFAKGLALAHGVPLVGVPTFEIQMHALAGPSAGVDRVTAVVQAGRGRVIAANYVWDGLLWVAEGAPQVLDWAALAAEVRPLTLICGEWDIAAPEHLRAFKGRAVFASPAHSLRRAGHLAEIGWERVRAGAVDDPATLAPIYAGQPQGAVG